MTDAAPAAPTTNRRTEALLSMLPALALLALATTTIMLLRDRLEPAGLALVAAVGGIPSVIMISRGWTRVLWADRLERARRKALAAPDNAEAQYDLGVLCALRGLESDAREAFEAAHRIDPKHAAATVGLGHLAADADDLVRALELFEAAAAQDPTLFAAHYGVAGVNMRREQFARAAAAFERALGIEPDDGYALAGLARCRLELGDLESARDLLERAAEMGVSDSDLLRDLRDAADEP